MKIEQILVLHLFNAKQVTLQGIGTLKLDSAFLPENSDGRIMFQNDAITFEYDPKVTQDSLLIDTIVQHTKKIKPLATSDLDSFIMGGKELLALNSPFLLKGIGSIIKTQNGAFKFVPELFAPAKIQKSKASPEKKSAFGTSKNYTAILSKSKKPLVFIVAVSVASLTALSLLNFFKNRKSNEKSITQTQKLPGTHTEVVKSTDTVKTGQIINTSEASSNNTYTFKIVFFQTANYEEALRKLNEIIGFGHSPVMHKSGMLYEVAMPFSLPLTDTLHIKDSLDQFYSLGKGVIKVE